MPIQVQLKRSTVAGVAPTTLADGELAINTADSRLFYKDSSASIQSFTLQPYATPGATNVSRVLSLNTITGAMSIVAGSLVSVATAGTAITISGQEEVVEYLTTSVFPATGSTTVLYLATDASRSYRWTGSEYVEVGTSALSGGSGGGSSDGSRALTFLLR